MNRLFTVRQINVSVRLLFKGLIWLVAIVTICIAVGFMIFSPFCKPGVNDVVPASGVGKKSL